MTSRDKKTFNPFPGLRPFAPEESDLFFGRKGESEEVLKKLLANRFVTVMGASGSGKSSLIFCGVMHRIRTGSDGTPWKIISFRPGNDPFGNLARAIREEGGPGDHGTTSGNESIAGMVKSLVTGAGEKVLMVIDQFEELFRYSALSCSDDSSRGKFVDSLVESVSDPSVNIFTILTMRSDFIGECAHYQGLTQLINNSNYLVPHMGRENYRQAIEGPVNYAGARIDPELVSNLLEHIGEKTDQLPVLQHAMMRTWTYWQQLDEPDRPIGKTDYDSVGTMNDAMSMHANEAFEELTVRGKEICEKMFKTITEKGSDNKGLRRPTPARVIMSIAGCTAEELFGVVEKFRIPSRSFITPRQKFSLSEDSIIDLSHESLMRLWDRLRAWVDDEASSVQMYLRLSEASAMYQQGKTSLWRPPDLQLAINWRDQHKPTLAWAGRYDPAFERAMVYLRTSEKEYQDEEDNKIRLQKRQMRRTKIAAMILGTAAFISVAFMLYAFVQKIQADRQTEIAVDAQAKEKEQRAVADSNRIKAEKQKVLADSSAKVAILNEAEANRQSQIATQEQLRAERSAAEARRQEARALLESDSARAARIRADANAQRATLEKNRALQLRMLSIGKAMSIKSLQAQGEKELQALLAYQAYLFNKKNSGIENDADIYAGLYNVAKQSGVSDCRSFKGHNGQITGIAYVPGKNEFYTSGTDGQVLKWEMEAKEQALQVIYNGRDEKTGITEVTEVLAISPDASWLACAVKYSNNIRMIPLKPQNTGYVLKGHKGQIKSLIYSYDGKYLYSAGLDDRVLKWDLAAHTSIDVADGSMKINSIDISSNGNYIAGISRDGSVIVWNPEDKSDNFRLETAGRNIKTIRFNPGNNLLAIGDQSGTVELWDVNLKKRVSSIKAHDAQVNDIRFNSLMSQMATAGMDKKLKIFNISNPADLTQPPVTFSDDEYVMVMQFSHNGQLIVSGAYQGTENLVCRPSYADYFIGGVSGILNRNMTQTEWDTYVAPDIPLEQTLADKNYNIKVSAIK